MKELEFRAQSAFESISEYIFYPWTFENLDTRLYQRRSHQKPLKTLYKFFSGSWAIWPVFQALASKGKLGHGFHWTFKTHSTSFFSYIFCSYRFRSYIYRICSILPPSLLPLQGLRPQFYIVTVCCSSSFTSVSSFCSRRIPVIQRILKISCASEPSFRYFSFTHWREG